MSETACPYCGETILAVARKCKHCGEYIDPTLRPESQAPKRARPRKRGFRLWMLFPMLIGGCMVAYEVDQRRNTKWGLRPMERDELYHELDRRENAAIQANMALTQGKPDSVFLEANKASKEAIRSDLARRYKVTRQAVDEIRQEGIAKKLEAAEARRSPR